MWLRASVRSEATRSAIVRIGRMEIRPPVTTRRQLAAMLAQCLRNRHAGPTNRSRDMSFSLYDAVIPSNLQILGALDRIVDKAEAFCEENAMTQAALIDAQLAADMLPFGYQVKSCAVHSIGGIDGARTGSFSPDMSAWPTDFAGLHGIVRRAMDALSALDRDTIDALADADTQFAVGETKLPFTGANFLLSFSQPNFYFHATMAYAILRAQGVKLGKRDFIGMPRMRVSP
ncbi:DUF1993 domain-containing protein [Sphingomonas sp. CARO-RG-8B-R24-01]|uniref:DUF1993 domain-containing protein n=1 Tax=Sphingomonas sp. CARO-RG-8B-R24-01 TaxID=2914831 RepID=UPI001F5838AF|nr:DUF1993 domain-containing protein [Sphingomonas sp. CARO-RG-8B-R24-01]